MKKHAISTALCLCLLTGCSGPKFVGRPGLTVVQGTELPAPTRQDLILQQRSYVIGPYDKVSVDVYGVPELSKSIQVDASGTIALPLIGVVEAAGKAPSELAQVIADKLRNRFVRDPQVTVNADTVNQTITVDGQVQKPGLYPVGGRMTLIRAVAQAEGTSDFADESYVVVLRQVDNNQMAALYDLRAIRQGIYADPEVFANDIVMVGESEGRRIFQQVLQGSGLLAAPLVALIQRN